MASGNLPGRRAWHRPAALSLARTARYAVPIRFCSRWGLPCRLRCRRRGALLPHLFTLTRLRSLRCFGVASPRACHAMAPKGRRRAVRSLWHFPWGRPRRTLSGTVCQGSPDFPPRRPFGVCRGGRPADWRLTHGHLGRLRQAGIAAHAPL